MGGAAGGGRDLRIKTIAPFGFQTFLTCCKDVESRVEIDVSSGPLRSVSMSARTLSHCPVAFESLSALAPEPEVPQGGAPVSDPVTESPPGPGPAHEAAHWKEFAALRSAGQYENGCFEQQIFELEDLVPCKEAMGLGLSRSLSGLDSLSLPSIPPP
jgi:hypothetical protein